MQFPWANIALVFLFAVELLTGYLGLTHSSPDWIAAMHLHRITGFAILFLFLWKSRNIIGSFRSGWNWRTSPGRMLASTALLLGLLIVLALGLAWSNLGAYNWLGMSGTTLHILLALLLIPLLLWHSLRHRISFRRRYLADRRNFLRLAGMTAAGLALWQLAETANRLTNSPGAQRRFTGSYPENGPDFPVTSWLNDRTPAIDPAQWRLRINGHVANPYEITLDELSNWQDELTATLDCTGGWYTTRQWQGASVAQLLAQANPRPGAGSITIRSRTGYYRRYSLTEANRALLAARVDGAPLSPGHGYPARIIEPQKRGYDWVKWVDEITINDTSKFWQPPLPLT